MRIFLLSVTLLFLFLQCKKTDTLKKTNTVKNTTSITQDNTEIMKNDDKQTIEFSDLFNEGSIIKFGPKDIENTSDAEILDFKRRLNIYEQQHPLLEDFEPENLTILVNNQTFTESNHFINSEWLDYYIKKYHLENYLKSIMKIAIEQEDYLGVKTILKNGYIISLKEVNIAKDAKKNSDEIKKMNLKNNGLDESGDPTFYDSNESKIDDIMNLINRDYNLNKIYDKDGFTNLREGSSVNSNIITTIRSGEHIIVLDNIEQDVVESQKGWCYVQNKEGVKGYIHKSRITIN